MSATAIKTNAAQGLAPFSLKDVPSFIEAQFPVGRLSAEAYKERKAIIGQTLTALGSYWKGRKPLILARAVVLGALLPATEDPAKNLDIFLKLMAMDDGAFGHRFDGGAAEFARLFPAHAETVASNRGRVWRTDLPVGELKKRAAAVRPTSDIANAIEQTILAALMAFVKSARTTKPNTNAVAFAKVFPHLADDLTGASRDRCEKPARACRAIGHRPIQSSAEGGGYVLWRWVYSLRGGADRLRCLRL
jgi:hypothetical protein